MASTSVATPNLSEEQLKELATLLIDADTVELKLTVPEEQQRSTATALGLDPLDAQIRQVFFFDTPDLRLDASGLVVRARRVQNKGDDSVVKLRPVLPHELPESLRRTAGFGVEVDTMPGGFVCSASMKQTMAPAVKAVIDGEKKLRKLFSKEQRAFYSEHAPEGVTLEDLTVLGPIFVLKLRFAPKEGFPGKLVAELWLYPDGSRILELSTKCLPRETFQVAEKARAYLTERGVDLSGEQQTKTRTALEFFTR
jgi:hypothetical protein